MAQAFSNNQFSTQSVPEGLIWNNNLATKARERLEFIHVGSKSGKWVLSGAQDKWTKPDAEISGTVYSISHRVAGTPSNITTSLRYANVSEDEIRQVITNSISQHNVGFEPFKSQFENEINNRISYKEQESQKPSFEWEQILWFAENLQFAQMQTKTNENRAPAVARKKKENNSLEVAISSLQDGQVIDVSNIDTATGSGRRTLKNRPKEGKYGADGIPIVSNDLNRYIYALEKAYGPDSRQRFANEIAYVEQQINNKKNNIVHAPMQASMQASMQVTQAPPPVMNSVPLAKPSPRAPVSMSNSVAPVQVSAPAQPPARNIPSVRSPGIGVKTMGGSGLTNFPSFSAISGR